MKIIHEKSELVTAEIGNRAELHMASDSENVAYVMLDHRRKVDLIISNGELSIICFEPVKIINQFEDKKE